MKLVRGIPIVEVLFRSGVHIGDLFFELFCDCGSGSDLIWSLILFLRVALGLGPEEGLKGLKNPLILLQKSAIWKSRFSHLFEKKNLSPDPFQNQFIP